MFSGHVRDNLWQWRSHMKPPRKGGWFHFHQGKEASGSSAAAMVQTTGILWQSLVNQSHFVGDSPKLWLILRLQPGPLGPLGPLTSRTGAICPTGARWNTGAGVCCVCCTCAAGEAAPRRAHGLRGRLAKGTSRQWPVAKWQNSVDQLKINMV